MSPQSEFDPQAPEVVATAELFKALASTVRISILQAIREPMSVGQLAEHVGITQPLVSQHLRVLRYANLVTVSRQGRESHYQVADHHINHVVDDAMAHVQERP